MDFRKKGWLKQYLHLRNNYTLKKEYDRLMEIENAHEPETILYELLQPTGFLYGHPANIPINYKSFLRALRTEKMPMQDKTKIILTESFLHSGLISPRYQQISQRLDVADALLESAIFIGKFYRAVYPNLFTTHTSGFFRRDKKGLELSEYLIGMRVGDDAQASNFWGQFFRSSLLFLDVLYFGQWLHAFRTDHAAEQLLQNHREDRLLIFKTILAAAYANKTLEKEEKQLIQSYLEVAQFDEETHKNTLELIDKGLNISALEITTAQSQVMKKHLLELAILTVCADREVNQAEQEFLDKLRKKLKLDYMTFQSSMIAVESFIVEYWQQIQMQDEDKIKALGTHLLNRISLMLKEQEESLIQALNQHPHLVKLLLKNQQEKLSTEDRNKIRKGLFEVINTLPYFTAIALPKAYLTFPNLMEVLPQDLLLHKSLNNA
ncbi:hypothetical protein OKW21_001967 [Catalinimonas alkaloidigena]|uniref:DUF533 domain-containing protein n=1 Tax=Catalinimonas alkaloidigena TaxID=1075417 RepID=UPI0024055A05|nr:DUF533 domain-containing protein [Catalinimonas alkaloidigena]MDF9796704.1 hypothetical protein [Catalinimonas alkaloidigena]